MNMLRIFLSRSQGWSRFGLLLILASGLGSCATTGTTVDYQGAQELSALSAAELYRFASLPEELRTKEKLTALARRIEEREGVPEAVTRHRQANKQRATYRESKKLLPLAKLGELPDFGGQPVQLDAGGRDALFEAGVTFTASEQDAGLVIEVAPVRRCPRVRRSYREVGASEGVLKETLLVPGYTLYDVSCDPDLEGMSFVLDELVLDVGKAGSFRFAVGEDAEVAAGSYLIVSTPEENASAEGLLEGVVAYLGASGSFEGLSLSGSGQLAYSSASKTIAMGEVGRAIELQPVVDRLGHLALAHSVDNDPERSVELDEPGTAAFKNGVLGGTVVFACTVGSDAQTEALLNSVASLVACDVGGLPRACWSSCDLSPGSPQLLGHSVEVVAKAAAGGKARLRWSLAVGMETPFFEEFGEVYRSASSVENDLKREPTLEIKFSDPVWKTRFVAGSSRSPSPARVPLEWGSPKDHRNTWLQAHRSYAASLLAPPKARYEELTFEDDAGKIAAGLSAGVADARITLDSLYCREREPRVDVPEIEFARDKQLCRTLDRLDVVTSEKHLAGRIAALQKKEDHRLAAVGARTFTELSEILPYLKDLAVSADIHCRDGDEFEQRECKQDMKRLRPAMTRWLKKNRLVAEVAIEVSEFDFASRRYSFTVDPVVGGANSDVFHLVKEPPFVYTGSQKCGKERGMDVPVHKPATYRSPQMSADEAEDSSWRKAGSGLAIVSLIPQTSEICCSSRMRKLVNDNYRRDGGTCTYYPYVAKIHELMIEDEPLVGFTAEHFERSLTEKEVEQFEGHGH